MQDIWHSLKKYIKSGDYYQDAKNWYLIKYVHPEQERLIFISLVLIVCAVAIAGIIGIDGIKEIPNTTVFYMQLGDDFDKLVHIYEADESSTPFQHQVALKLIPHYVKTFEQYNYAKLADQYKYIWSNSSEAVFNQFQQLYDLTNPFSLINQYQDNFVKELEVEKVNLTKTVRNYGSAKVHWQMHLVDLSTGTKQNYAGVSDLQYYISDLLKNKEQEYLFQITRYQTQQQ